MSIAKDKRHNALRRTFWEYVRHHPGCMLSEISGLPATTKLKLNDDFAEAGYITRYYVKHGRQWAYRLTMAPKWAGVPFEESPEYIPISEDETETIAPENVIKLCYFAELKNRLEGIDGSYYDDCRNIVY